MLQNANLTQFPDIEKFLIKLVLYYLPNLFNLFFSTHITCKYSQKAVDLQNIMDKKTLEFVTYCISKLAQQLNLSQREVYERLYNSGILYDYIVPSYDVLHTFSSRYLMEDLTDYMKEKGVLPQ